MSYMGFRHISDRVSKLYISATEFNVSVQKVFVVVLVVDLMID